MAAFKSSLPVAVVAAILVVVECERYREIRSGLLGQESETDETGDDFEQDEPKSPSMAVVPLNRFIFDGNVVQCVGQHTDHWIVHFCPDWYEPCQRFVEIFKNTSVQWQEKLNSDIVMRSRARFAEVDCATDKELCNDQLVDDYPTVVHYLGGKRVSEWTADDAEFGGFNRWLQKELQSAKEPHEHSWLPKGWRAEKEKKSASPGDDPSLLSLLLFVPIFACPFIIVFKDAHLAPAGPTSSSQSRPRAAAEQVSERPSGADDDDLAESSVAHFMPASWTGNVTRVPRGSQSIEL